MPVSPQKNKLELALEAFRLWVGDPKTRIPKLLIIAGIPLVASPWWQPFLNGLAAKWLGLDATKLESAEVWLVVSGWVLILLGIILYIRATTKGHAGGDAEPSGTDTSIPLDSSVPLPIQRNALTAFDQLCTAVVDLPRVYIDSVVQEKQALTKARVRQIEHSSQQLATDYSVSPEYVKATGKKFVERIVRQQINLDEVAAAAANEINNQARLEGSAESTSQNQDVPSIDPDWLNQFETEARHVSSEAMRLLFGRILAGEIQRPNSFSMRTIKTLRELDVNTANLFRQLCSCVVSLRIENHILDARVPSLDGNAASNSLQQFGLGFGQLNILNEYGLIISDYNSYYDYRICVIYNNSLPSPFTYQHAKWGLFPLDGIKPEDNSPVYHKELRLSGVALSRVGKELLPIVDIDDNAKYTSAMSDYWEKQKFRLTMVEKPTGT